MPNFLFLCWLAVGPFESLLFLYPNWGPHSLIVLFLPPSLKAICFALPYCSSLNPPPFVFLNKKYILSFALEFVLTLCLFLLPLNFSLKFSFWTINHHSCETINGNPLPTGWAANPLYFLNALESLATLWISRLMFVSPFIQHFSMQNVTTHLLTSPHSVQKASPTKPSSSLLCHLRKWQLYPSSSWDQSLAVVLFHIHTSKPSASLFK